MLLLATENVVDTMPVQTFYYVLYCFLGILITLSGSVIALVIYIFTKLDKNVNDTKTSVTTMGEKVKTDLTVEIDKKASIEKVDGNYNLLLGSINETKEIKNPFYGYKMMTCGSVEEMMK